MIFLISLLHRTSAGLLWTYYAGEFGIFFSSSDKSFMTSNDRLSQSSHRAQSCTCVSLLESNTCMSLIPAGISRDVSPCDRVSCTIFL